jgi:hypothetical protein
MKRIVILLLLIFPACLWAADFGASLNQEFGYGGIGGETEMDYLAGLIPYFSTPLGNSGNFYISAQVKAVYEYETFAVVGELLHTELSWNFNSFKIRAGRIPYAAPLDFIAEGFFDGAQFSLDTNIGTFNLGGWYTGLLYKKSANITITPEDFISYYTALDYGDFSNTYFASKRMLMAVGWEHPAIAGMIRARADVTGQIDLNGTDIAYNSAYFSAKTLIPVKQFIFAAGGCFQMAKAGEETGYGAAGELGFLWIMPASFSSRLSLVGRYGSGETGGINAFVPITTKPQGGVLQAKLSGISALFLDYTAQLHQTFSAGLTASCFIRNDEVTYTVYPVANPVDNSGSVLGSELFGRIVWDPLTDLSFTLGAGIFLPSLGNVNPKADAQWRLELGLLLVLF